MRSVLSLCLTGEEQRSDAFVALPIPSVPSSDCLGKFYSGLLGRFFVGQFISNGFKEVMDIPLVLGPNLETHIRSSFHACFCGRH